MNNVLISDNDNHGIVYFGDAHLVLSNVTISNNVDFSVGCGVLLHFALNVCFCIFERIIIFVIYGILCIFV